MDYKWNWGILLQPAPEGFSNYLVMLLSGLEWTVITALVSWVIALILGAAVGVTSTLQNRFLRQAAFAYVELFRNIPLLVQMFLWYFVAPEILPHELGLWVKQLPNSAFITTAISLGFYTSARVAVQVGAGIRALPTGQRMAGLASGLTPAQVYRYILLPTAFRIILPPLTSEFLNNTKNTSVGLTIGLLELTARARSMQEYSFQVFEAFTVATLMYLAVSLSVVLTMRALERKVAIPGTITNRADPH